MANGSPATCIKRFSISTELWKGSTRFGIPVPPHVQNEFGVDDMHGAPVTAIHLYRRLFKINVEPTRGWWMFCVCRRTVAITRFSLVSLLPVSHSFPYGFDDIYSRRAHTNTKALIAGVARTRRNNNNNNNAIFGGHLAIVYYITRDPGQYGSISHWRAATAKSDLYWHCSGCRASSRCAVGARIH